MKHFNRPLFGFVRPIALFFIMTLPLATTSTLLLDHGSNSSDPISPSSTPECPPEYSATSFDISLIVAM